MLNYIRLITISTICVFYSNFKIFAVEFINDEKKINEGTYVYDPFENINRSVLNFNIIFDEIAIQPVISTYKTLTPDLAEKGISNFFKNLREPLNTISFLLQGDPKSSLNSIGRFIINTSTSLGVYDTSNKIGLKPNSNDMGVVIGKIGIPSGPYLVIPILGPTNLRDITGRAFDFYLDPINLSSNELIAVKNSGELVSMRAEYDNELNNLKNNSNDLYDSVKLFYHQRRMGKINEDHLRDLPVPQIYIELD